MLMPQTVEYAFRAMACLALAGDEPRRVEDLAARTEVPRPYLSRVMRQLVVAGLVSSQRGLHGGYRLRRAPDEIRYSDILDAMHFSSGQGHCAFGLPQCNEDKPCPLHDSWREMQGAFRGWAREHTLADVTSGEVCVPLNSSES